MIALSPEGRRKIRKDCSPQVHRGSSLPSSSPARKKVRNCYEVQFFNESDSRTTTTIGRQKDYHEAMTKIEILVSGGLIRFRLDRWIKNKKTLTLHTTAGGGLEGADTRSLIPPSRSPVWAGARGGGSVSAPPLAARGRRSEVDAVALDVWVSLVGVRTGAGGELRPDE